MKNNSWRWLLCTVVMGLCWQLPVLAGGLRASPLRLEFHSAKQVQQLRIGNTDDSRNLIVQLELLRWSQIDGEELLEPSRDFLATPPIMQIGPQSERLVRVGPRHFPQDRCESSYRLVITEIPPNQGKQPPLRFRTRIRLPVFAYSRDGCQAQVQWRWQDKRLIAENRGSAHVQFQKLSLRRGDRHWPVPLQQVGYVLPGAQLSHPLPEDLGEAPITLITRTRQGEKSLTLTPND